MQNFHIRDFSQNSPTKKPKTLALILHGYGADGENLVDLAEVLHESLEFPLFIIPDAPFGYEYAPDMGNQWFSLLDRTESVLVDGAETARKILLNFIDEHLEKYELGYENLVLIGFSQGAMMSIFTALQLPKSCKAVVSFSGTMVSGEQTIATCKSKPPICIIHGSKDDVVPLSLGKFTAKTLKSIGFSVEMHEIQNLQHAIDLQSVKIAADFLKNL